MKSQTLARLELKETPAVPFDVVVKLARKMLEDVGSEASTLLNCIKPSVVHEVLASGNVRLALLWSDGMETNECMITRQDGPPTFAA